MSGMQTSASVEATLNWNYDSGPTRIRHLHERALRAQWHVDDVDWATEVNFGGPLADDSAYAMAAFAASPLADRGRAMWDTFRWELQSWMVSQFLHGEQGALVVAGRLVETLPDLDGKLFAAGQAVDEARHVEVFSRYLREKVPHPYPVSAPLESLLRDILADSRWDVTTLGMQIMVEALAMAAFRLANSTFHDDVIKQIAQLVARDEARHVTFGVLCLDGVIAEMSTAERAEREDLVLDAANLTRKRFLLAEIWERLDVDPAAGMTFAATNDLMISYRRTIFSRLVPALDRIGLLTGRVLGGLDQLELLNSVTWRGRG